MSIHDYPNVTNHASRHIVCSNHAIMPVSPTLDKNPILQEGIPGMTRQEFTKLENDMQILFTRYIQLNDRDLFEVNAANLTADGQRTQIRGLRRLAAALNGIQQSAAPSNNTVGATIVAIKEGIRAWNWGLTARTVARILSPSAVKALGGPVGIGVALGWAAWSCRGRLCCPSDPPGSGERKKDGICRQLRGGSTCRKDRNPFGRPRVDIATPHLGRTDAMDSFHRFRAYRNLCLLVPQPFPVVARDSRDYGNHMRTTWSAPPHCA